MKKLTCILSLIGLATPLFAQQGVYQLDRFALITPLQIAVTQDSNFLVEDPNPLNRLFLMSLPPSVQAGFPQGGPQRVSDQILTLTMPTVALYSGTRRYELTGTYMPEFEIFRKNRDENAWNHAAMAEFTYFPSRTTRFSIGDDYRGSQDPTRTQRNPYLLVPRAAFRQNTIRGVFDLEASPVTLFSVDYSNTMTTYGQTDPLQVRILDTIANGGSFTVRRLLSRKQRLSGSVSYFKLKPINNERINDDAVDTPREFEHPIKAFKLQYRYSFSASTSLELVGGVTDLDNGTNYLMRVGGYRRFGEFWIGGGYSREIALTGGTFGLPVGLSNTYAYDLVSVRINGQPTRYVGVQAELAGNLSASQRVVDGGRSLLFRGRADYRLTDRTVTFASYETHQQPANDYVRVPMSRNRFTVGLEFSLATDTQRRMDPRNQDDQYVALTDHGRRRRPPE